MATGFVKNVHRYDPYRNFKFRILMDNKPVLGVSKVGALKRTTEVVKHREGGENSTDHKFSGRTTYDAITLERGITHDREFEQWANLVHPYAHSGGAFRTYDLAFTSGQTSIELSPHRGSLWLEGVSLFS